MHGEWLQTASSPCIFVSGRFLNAWGMAPNGFFPMHFCFWKLLICMGKEPKGVNPMQPRVRKLLICMGKALNGENPMQANFWKLPSCMGNGTKRCESHAGHLRCQQRIDRRPGRVLTSISTGLARQQFHDTSSASVKGKKICDACAN